MDRTEISVRSVLRVLKGVAVATKAPDQLIHTASTLVKHLDRTDSGYDSPHEDADGHGARFSAFETISKRFTFEEWRKLFDHFAYQSEDKIGPLLQAVLAIALLREKSLSGAEANSSELDLIWSLVYEAILGAEDSEVKFGISRSAQGCMVVTLCSLVTDGRIEELWRFHIWLPDGERGMSDVAIHSHQCWARSWILLGKGTDVTFKAEDTNDAKLATHAAYKLHWASADGSQSGAKFTTHQKSSTIRNSGKLVRLTPNTRETHSRDMTYTIPHATLHQSIVPKRRLHATLFVFDSSRGYDADAGVVGPVTGGDYTQIRAVETVTAAGLAELVDKSRRWEQTHGAAVEGDDEHPVVMQYYEECRDRTLRKFRESGTVEKLAL